MFVTDKSTTKETSWRVSNRGKGGVLMERGSLTLESSKTTTRMDLDSKFEVTEQSMKGSSCRAGRKVKAQ